MKGYRQPCKVEDCKNKHPDMDYCILDYISINELGECSQLELKEKE